METPAGTSRPLHYDAASNEFRPEQRAGTDRTVDFLPYPANAGFVPGTRLPPTPRHPRGGPQPALVLAEAQPPGTVLEVLPVGLLLLDDAGEMESVVLTVPARPSQQIMPVSSWRELTARYPAAREVLGLWYRHSGEAGAVRIVGWRDEQAAEQRIRKVLSRP
ncbi:inorganic diphosphatase [Hymenobacter gummosus]|uniref:inorganic diphosphatase n=1 Tax=Hymenobacter gummosus TaxID=1776032 RepID=UPI001404AB8D|nr:inorganic diphosphatase [Hymenobacter gummosus]